MGRRPGILLTRRENSHGQKWGNSIKFTVWLHRIHHDQTPRSQLQQRIWVPRTTHLNLLALHPACDATNPKSVDAVKKRVSDQHGIDVSAVTTANGCVYNYTLHDSRDMGIQLTTPATAQGLQQADAEFSEQANKRTELTKTYGVTFGAPGEFIGNAEVKRGTQTVARRPLYASPMPLNQLLGIEAGLKQSSPDLTPGQAESQCDSLTHISTLPEPAVAQYHAQSGGKPPNITFFPFSTLVPVTSKSSRQQFADSQRLRDIKAEDPKLLRRRVAIALPTIPFSRPLNTSWCTTRRLALDGMIRKRKTNLRRQSAGCQTP